MENRQSTVDLGICSFKLYTTDYDWYTAHSAFDSVGLADKCPEPTDKYSAFVRTIAELDKRGYNPKVRDNVQPLLNGYRVLFKKVDQRGRTGVTCNVLTMDASKVGGDAICKQVIEFNDGNVTFSRPNGMDPNEYDPDFMKAAFLQKYQDCQRVHSEDIRRVLHSILPKRGLQWINGRIVCYYPASEHETVSKVVRILLTLKNVAMNTLFEVTERNRANLAEAFVASLADNVGALVGDISKKLDSATEKRESTLTGFGDDLANLEATIGYYQMLLGVANEQVTSYLDTINGVKSRIKAKLQSALEEDKAPTVEPAKVAPVEASKPVEPVAQPVPLPVVPAREESAPIPVMPEKATKTHTEPPRTAKTISVKIDDTEVEVDADDPFADMR